MRWASAPPSSKQAKTAATPAATQNASICPPFRSKPSTPPEQATASSPASSQGFWSRRACGSAVRKGRSVRRSAWGMRERCERASKRIFAKSMLLISAAHPCSFAAGPAAGSAAGLLLTGSSFAACRIIRNPAKACQSLRYVITE